MHCLDRRAPQLRQRVVRSVRLFEALQRLQEDARAVERHVAHAAHRHLLHLLGVTWQHSHVTQAMNCLYALPGQSFWIGFSDIYAGHDLIIIACSRLETSI